ncbi:MAG: V4R domain-containing protein [Promethearchaeota archaeon]
MFKKLKKELQIKIDEEKGQLFLGDPQKDLRLLMLRPIDLIEFLEFAGTNAMDIIMWAGKSIGKNFMGKFFYQKDWSEVDLSTKKQVILGILEGFGLLGFGYLRGIFKEDHILINVYNSIVKEEKTNVMAKNLCYLYEGLLNGVMESLGIEVESKEIECTLLGDDKCTFKFTLITQRFGEEDVDPDESEAVTEFLSTL